MKNVFATIALQVRYNGFIILNTLADGIIAFLTYGLVEQSFNVEEQSLQHPFND